MPFIPHTSPQLFLTSQYSLSSSYFTPAVFDFPVLLIVIMPVSNYEASMVQSGVAACLFVVYTFAVQLEGLVSGVDADGDGSDLAHGILKVRFGSRLDVDAPADGGSRERRVVLAVTINCGVRVSFFGLDTVLVDVLEPLVHESAAAAHVALGLAAVDQVLFRQRDEFAGLREHLSFQGPGSTESPTRSAFLLVLDGGDVALVDPVDLLGGVVHVVVPQVLVATETLAASEGFLPQQHVPPFVVGQIGEFVHVDGEGVFSLCCLHIVSRDEHQVVLPRHLPPRFLNVRRVCLAMVVFP